MLFHGSSILPFPIKFHLKQGHFSILLNKNILQMLLPTRERTFRDVIFGKQREKSIFAS